MVRFLRFCRHPTGSPVRAADTQVCRYERGDHHPPMEERGGYLLTANSFAAAAAKEKSNIVVEAISGLTPAVAASMAI